MTISKNINHDRISMNVMDVIYNRRIVRDYLFQKIDQDRIHTLWKDELEIPAEMTAIVPITVGWPAGKTPPSPRTSPEILTWK